jgi:hypothetical protein
MKKGVVHLPAQQCGEASAHFVQHAYTLQPTTFDSPSVYKQFSVRPLLTPDVPAKSLRLLPYM